MVSRTWSVRSKIERRVVGGVGVVAVGRDGLAELDEPLARQRHRTERPEQRERRGDREVRQPQRAGQRPDVAQQRVDLLGPDDRHRDDRLAGPDGRRDEAAAAEALQLVPLAERLADALEALGEHRHQLAGGEQPLGVGVAGQRVAGPAGDRPEDGGLEHEIGSQVADHPARRVVVGDAGGEHHRIDGDGAGVIGDQQRPTGVRQVLHAEELDPEPLVVQQAERRQHDVAGEVLVVAEVVDLVVAGDPAAQERQPAGDAGLPAGLRGRVRGGVGARSQAGRRRHGSWAASSGRIVSARLCRR